MRLSIVNTVSFTNHLRTADGFQFNFAQASHNYRGARPFALDDTFHRMYFHNFIDWNFSVVAQTMIVSLRTDSQKLLENSSNKKSIKRIIIIDKKEPRMNLKVEVFRLWRQKTLSRL